MDLKYRVEQVIDMDEDFILLFEVCERDWQKRQFFGRNLEKEENNENFVILWYAGSGFRDLWQFRNLGFLLSTLARLRQVAKNIFYYDAMDYKDEAWFCWYVWQIKGVFLF